MIALAIIGLIIGLGAPRLMGTFGSAKSKAAEIRLDSLKGAIQYYYIDTGQYPNAADGLEALLREPRAVSDWNGPYVDGPEDLLDPWGRRFIYSFPGNERPFDLSSYGRDGQPGGDNEDKDINL